MEIDYEKKYEEALAKARAGKTLEEIFPEMNESEDESIREWLVDYFKAVERACIHWDISPERIVSYLEKQKDASKAIEAIERIDKYIDEHVANAHDMKDSNPDKKYYRGWDDALAKMSGILQDVYSDEKQKEQKLTESISQLTVQGKGVYKICPRCKERMVRDDSKVYTSMPPKYGYNCPKCGTMEFDTVMYDNPEMEEQKPAECADDVVEEAEEYASKVACGEYGVEVTEAYIAGVLSERNRGTEWSEFDKDVLEDAICATDLLGNDESFNKSNPNLAKAFRVAKDWLESLPLNLKKKNEDVAKLCSNEWSEEDTEMYINVASSLRGYACGLENEEHKKHIQKGLDWLENRFKFLRPQPQPHTVSIKDATKFGNLEYERGVKDGIQSEKNRHWKPSEEQMEALDKALYYVPEEIGIPIAEIYGHFNKMKKKLM